MTGKAMLNRRTFLYGTAAAAGGVMLAACSSGGGSTDGSGPKKNAGDGGNASTAKGSNTKALPKPSKFQESPLLAEQVKAGKLDAIEKRLPENPFVIPHKWVKPGKFGGDLLMISPSASGGAIDASNKEYMYGHTLLRWLNDGLAITGGLVESWEHNADASEWTLHFRKGLRWSDGEPWSTEDIMFWWNDLVLNTDHSETPPDECKSGTGKVATLSAVDPNTLTMKFDAPAPLTADRLAMWVKGTNGNGPKWMVPAHFAKQYHPKYNKKVGKSWASAGGLFETKVDFSRNPDCPTMTGWKLKSIKEGRSIVWERNPYYHCVMPNGDQLPYVDTLNMSVVQDKQVGKLQMQQGKLDYVHGPFFGVALPDISAMKQSQKTSKLDVLLWDGGSGTGSVFFFNYDHKDPKLRKLIREPKFRKALSMATKRADMQKAIYFNTGEQTTGTLSPKAKEYKVNDEGKQVYQQWRDSALKYDPAAAKKLLDELGVVDKDGDGYREFPDGSKLKFTLDFPADTTDDHKQKNSYLERDWKAIGIKAQQNPVAPQGWGDLWNNGKLTSTTAWEVGDGPNHLVYPQWLVPIENSRYCPLEGSWYNVRGTPDEGKQANVDPFKRTPPRMEPEKGGPIDQLWKIYDKSKVEPDEMKRTQMVWEMIKIHIKYGPFFQGSVANTPQVVLARQGLMNIPKKENLAQGGFVNPWIHPTPAVYDPETFFWDKPDQHKV
ncbi:ABC transporter substrate-binding protein [Actinopolymorpha cephalotaxi]|uniref:Peptide/nickel transport system substrate-binding protein n=2 Tax=Actinopolymorpha cephalotaxi TaxID=504797 RepID=A0ABX2RZI7_9ACTN|nr:ABC transporter substrate-binding protein [Actinopolymorpha cephalotaxi]NYH81466.1 peptide/nickel transport system substrate-binding protein [Actinopolymorpha cephalotaxi]